jgi:hypothetical protein
MKFILIPFPFKVNSETYKVTERTYKSSVTHGGGSPVVFNSSPG